MSAAKGDELKPFARCPALDGYHCNTNSLAKIFNFYDHPLSEDLLLGLGAGLGFIYWCPKGGYPFVGGRGNPKGFYADLGRRTGVRIAEVSGGAKKAEAALLERLQRQEPVMAYGDMGYMPWFELPEGYHFGGHTFVVCGYDGGDRVLISDMAQREGGLKKGFYSPVTLEQLRLVRGSKEKPFPPRNTYLDFDFSDYHKPTPEDLHEAIGQAAEAMLSPPIKNLGVKGLRHTAKELLKWPDQFDESALMLNLFNLYIFIEIGGTGGGCFRPMYARFLREVAQITGERRLAEAAGLLDQSGRLFTKAGLLFQDYEDKTRLRERIQAASEGFEEIAGIEEEAFQMLMP